MKKVIVIVLVLLLAAGVYWFMRSASHGGTTVQIAFGYPDAQGMLMNGVVTDTMTSVDPPEWETEEEMRYHGANQKWVTGHFDLLDEAGTRIALKYLDMSRLIAAPGNASFFEAKLTPGKKYTLCYRPKADRPVRYKGVFLVPDAPQQAKQYILGPVR
jgi:hypothetical protein